MQHAACDSISYKTVLGLHGSPKSETYESESFFIAYNFYNSSNHVAPTRALAVRGTLCGQCANLSPPNVKLLTPMLVIDIFDPKCKDHNWKLLWVVEWG